MQGKEAEIEFRETQSFRQQGAYVVYGVLLAILVFFIYADVQQIIFRKPFGDKPATNFVLLFITFFVLAMLLLFFVAKLETKITGEGVQFRWVPFQSAFSNYKWEHIIKAEFIEYGFVGYCLRLTPHGTIHNVAGNKGLAITLQSGRIIVGTQKPEALEAFLKQIRKLP